MVHIKEQAICTGCEKTKTCHEIHYSVYPGIQTGCKYYCKDCLSAMIRKINLTELRVKYETTTAGLN